MRYKLRAAEWGKPAEVWRLQPKREILIRARRSPSSNSNSSHEGGKGVEGMGAFNHLLVLLSGPIWETTNNKWRV